MLLFFSELTLGYALPGDFLEFVHVYNGLFKDELEMFDSFGFLKRGQLGRLLAK